MTYEEFVKRNRKYGEINHTYLFERFDKKFIIVEALNVLKNHKRN